MKLHVIIILCGICVGIPLQANMYRKKYEPYKPQIEKNDSIRNFTKIGIGVGLCAAALVTGKYTYDNAKELIQQGTLAGNGGVWSTGWTAANDKFWNMWGYEKQEDPTGVQENILKKWGKTTGWGFSTAVLAVLGLRLIYHGAVGSAKLEIKTAA